MTLFRCCTCPPRALSAGAHRPDTGSKHGGVETSPRLPSAGVWLVRVVRENALAWPAWRTLAASALGFISDLAIW